MISNLCFGMYSMIFFLFTIELMIELEISCILSKPLTTRLNLVDYVFYDFEGMHIGFSQTKKNVGNINRSLQGVQ
jgi:hypothetical protein